ncbi:hypothetical protein ACC728_40080, partial [Rhizobium ruizarguesonis]
ATYTRDRPVVSAFELADGAVYHSYSSYARGLDGQWFGGGLFGSGRLAAIVILYPALALLLGGEPDAEIAVEVAAGG